MVQGSGFGVQGSGFRGQGFRAQSFRFRVTWGVVAGKVWAALGVVR